MDPLLTNGVQPADIDSIQRIDSKIVSVTFSGTQKINILYGLPIDGFNPNELRVFLLEKQNLPEDSILEVYLDDFVQTAGHIFPLRLFETEESSYTQKPEDNKKVLRFQKAATAALCHFARVDHPGLKPGLEGEPVSLVSIFGEDTVVLTLSNDSSRTPSDFNLAKYLPCLFQYGYFYKCPLQQFQVNHYRTLPPFEDIPSKSNLKLKKISSDIPNFAFVELIFRELLPRDWSPISSFFLCYQIVEICIEEIRRINCEQFITRLESSKNDAVINRSVISEYQRDSSEKGRIKQIFSTYLDAADLSGTLIEGKALLERLGVEELLRKENAVSLYALRNYFFHAFPLVQKNCTPEQLQSISWEFFLLVLEILTCFKKNWD